MKPNLMLSSIFIFDKNDRNKKIAFAVWMLITLFCTVQSLATHRYNNFLIFENTVENLFQQQSFYLSYPNIHFDVNHYGPIFSVFFMPFAALPKALGLIFWNFFNSIILFKAIELIPLKNKNPLYFIAIPCLFSASLSEQFNPAAAAFIILSYTQLNKKKGFWSAMFIMLGTFIKLYGIVGLAFFFFVEDKKRFIGYLLFWGTIFFLLPMLFSSPTFIIQSYQDWANSLIQKNTANISEVTTDISIMGFIRSLFVDHPIPNSFFLLTGVMIFGLPYLNVKAYKSEIFRLYMLASVLLFPVLFSTGSEDCTYVIAVIGVGIWYVYAEKTIWKKWFFAVILLFSCDLPMLFFPRLTDDYPVLLSMMSFPFFVAWIFIICKAGILKKEEELIFKETPQQNRIYSI